MYKISIQTTNFLNDREGYDEKFQILKNAGFDAIDYNINANISIHEFLSSHSCPFFDMDEDQIIAHLTPFKASALKNGLFFGQMHAPYPPYIIGNDKVNRYIFETFKKSIRAAAFLECPFVVIHPINVAYSLGAEREHQLNMEMFTSLIPYAKEYGVTVCLENMFQTTKGHLYEAVCADFNEAAKYVDDLNEIAGKELFGFCFDLGHANILGKNIRRSLDILGSRVKALHIHDNNTNEDLHLMPFTFAVNWGTELTTDWTGFINGLADIDYKGTISFETHQAYHVFPKQVHPQMLSLMAAIGRYFSDEIIKEKQRRQSALQS